MSVHMCTSVSPRVNVQDFEKIAKYILYAVTTATIVHTYIFSAQNT